jgi:hypothetical protein
MPSRNGVRDDKEAGMTIQKKDPLSRVFKSGGFAQPDNVPLK